MSDERFVDLETKLAHQEQTLLELNDVVTQQQSTIMQLEELTRSLLERVRSLSDALPATSAGDEIPPHY